MITSSGLSVPLTVRVKGGNDELDRRITNMCHDLSFSTQAPGGFQQATVALNQPLILQPREYQQFGRMYIYDGRNGNTVFEGRMEDPGRSAGANGEVWQLSAVGGSTHTMDGSFPVVYIDRDLDHWEHNTGSGTDVKNGQFEVVDDDALLINIPPGTIMATTARIGGAYWGLNEASGNLAKLYYEWDTGGTTANYSVRSYTEDGSGVAFQNFDTAGGNSGTRVIGTNWTVGQRIPQIYIYRVGAQETSAVITNWLRVHAIVVMSTLYDINGTHMTLASNYSSHPLSYTPAEIATDVIGRWLPQIDGPTSYIEPSSVQIEQLTYHDPVPPQTVLDDLIIHEPGRYWAVWESNPGNDKFRFEYRSWPTEVAYEATTLDGFDAPATGSEVYNQARVRYRTPSGRIRTNVQVATVPLLDQAVGGGLNRSAHIDATASVKTGVGAAAVGLSYLEDHKWPSNSGRLRVSRPIWDHSQLRYVQPWELRAGKLIRVKGVLPNPDGLNLDARDGVTIFRVASTDYTQSDNTAILQLDGLSVTLARRIGQLAKAFRYNQRR